MELKIEKTLAFLVDWLQSHVLTWSMAFQWICIAVAYLATRLLWRGVERRLFAWTQENVAGEFARTMLRALVDIGNVALFVIVMQIGAECVRIFDANPVVLNAASDLAVAWIAIRLVTSIMPNRTMARVVAVLIWIIAALSVFDLLTPITDFLDKLSFSMGKESLTALDAVKGAAMCALLLQVASLATQFSVSRIEGSKGLSPSLQVLLVKAVKVFLFTTAILVSMSSVGIDLTSLAIFSSALGVGIGFGLKTIFSNYVAGVLLLADNSIKPGDTIEVGGVFGTVHEMHSRYASILTRDGKEHLVPNEVLISGEVVNWTFSDSNVRLKIPVGVAYESDVEQAMKLLEQAAASVNRVLKSPAPAARLVGFGDNSVDLQLRIWISDADHGVANVRSAVLLNIWNLFHEHGIEFPFPQRDIMLKPDSRLAVTIEKDSDAQ